MKTSWMLLTTLALSLASGGVVAATEKAQSRLDQRKSIINKMCVGATRAFRDYHDLKNTAGKERDSEPESSSKINECLGRFTIATPVDSR